MVSNWFWSQASAGTIHGGAAGPGSSAAAGAKYKDKCVLEIVSVLGYFILIESLSSTRSNVSLYFATAWSSVELMHNLLIQVGHPFPPLAYSNSQSNKKMIHNVLLSEARREYRLSKAAAKKQEISKQQDEEEIDW